jgi:hypothetical protein
MWLVFLIHPISMNVTPSGRASVSVSVRCLFLVILHGCETWSLTLREERRLRVFENRVLRKLFGPKRDEVTGNGESCITRS